MNFSRLTLDFQSQAIARCVGAGKHVVLGDLKLEAALAAAMGGAGFKPRINFETHRKKFFAERVTKSETQRIRDRKKNSNKIKGE